MPTPPRTPSESKTRHAPDPHEHSTDALIRSTEAVVRLEGSVAGLAKDMSEHRGEERAQWNTILAKLDNCDRSVQELRFVIEQQEKRLIAQVEEERKDRRLAVADGQKAADQSEQGAHALVKKLIDDELGARKLAREDQKEKRNLLVGAAKAIWEKGGQWVVAAVCLYLVLTLKTCGGSGFDLSKILGGN